MTYKHTQVSYLMITVTAAVLILFAWVYLTARAEAPSYDSGTNAGVTGAMALVVVLLASFVSLHVRIDDQRLRISFGYGIFTKHFALRDIQSANVVRNKWYYGLGIRWSLKPRMWIYAVSGLDAVELQLKNGKVYRIGTDEAQELEGAILQSIQREQRDF